MVQRRPEEVRQSLLHQVWTGVESPVTAAAAALGISRQAVLRHAKSLIAQGKLSVTGRGRATRYELPVIGRVAGTYLLSEVDEQRVWDALAHPFLDDLGAEDSGICHYGLTEIANNARDHSQGTKVSVSIERTAASVRIAVVDDGVGIFRKVAAALDLSDPREAALELSKGKVTTDPRRHTGEGVFFTSRAFDRFSIRAGKLEYLRQQTGDNQLSGDWDLASEQSPAEGTKVLMELLIPARRTLLDLFSRFSSGPDEYRFSRTHVPLVLAQYGSDQLISRSQAKRVLSRIEHFDEAALDFAGISMVGQGFADEIFRVFASERPAIKLVAINANDQVTSMIRRAQTALREQQDRG